MLYIILDILYLILLAAWLATLCEVTNYSLIMVLYIDHIYDTVTWIVHVSSCRGLLFTKPFRHNSTCSNGFLY